MKYISPLIICSLLIACSQQEKRLTLRAIDITNKNEQASNNFTKPKSDEEVRQAYAEYLKHSAKGDKARQDAIARLAELEFELGNRAAMEQESLNNNSSEEMEDKLFNARLDKTIELLETSRREYPKSKKNHQVLYNLANAYDQKGEPVKSELALKELVRKFPKSPYYIEAQFRLAENAFSRQDYIKAEDAYTEVVISKKNDRFYEKSRFKRGWSRFKQEYYIEAVEDFLETVTYHDFDDFERLQRSEKDLFKEYFRAIGLSFSYLGGVEKLNQYFANKPDFKYLYYTYAHIAEVYEKQHRFSDAADAHRYYIKTHPKSASVPLAHLKIFDIWKKGGFANKVYESLDEFYIKYNPQSKHWVNNKSDLKIYQTASQKLKDNIIIVAKDNHGKYLKFKKKKFFLTAQKWYERYLKHYASQAKKDNIHYAYAELLSQGRAYDSALKQYELAAFDTDIILNKDAAYASIRISSKLFYQKKKSNKKLVYRDKHLKYSLLFSQLYPNDKRTNNIINHAAELAFKSGNYQMAINLAELIPDNIVSSATLRSNIIKAHSYYKMGKYKLAEANYINAIQPGKTGPKTSKELTDKLGMSIYKQAEQEAKKESVEMALYHFSRIAKTAPESKYAATGLYDAIALTMAKEQWNTAVYYIKQFQSQYPRHKLAGDVSRKLSAVYLKSGQDIMAAREFENVAQLEGDKKLKTAALWKAAELYESKKDYSSAIKSYQTYANKYQRPFPQHMESMKKIVTLYEQLGDNGSANKWRNNILKADRRTARKLKTDRTKLIASSAALKLAKRKYTAYENQKLTLPLKTTLRKKKLAMKSAVRLFGRASVYGVPDTATEATHNIAEIYRSFSKALLESERPKNLNKDELEQYTILLEDKAFPFEEKAIEFYEANLSHVKNGVYNEWIKNSLSELQILFPVRYKRDVKVDAYINVIH